MSDEGDLERVKAPSEGEEDRTADSAGNSEVAPTQKPKSVVGPREEPMFDAETLAEPQSPIAVQSLSAVFRRDSLYAVVMAVQLLSSVLVTPVITRLLGPSGYGKVALALAISLLVWSVADLGLAIGVQREYVRSGEIEARRRLSLSLLGAIAFTGIALLMSETFGGEALGGSFLLGIVMGGMMSMTVSCLAILRCRGRLGQYALVNLLQVACGQLVGLGAVVVFGRSPVVYLAGVTASYGVSLIVAVSIARPVLSGLLEIRANLHLLAFTLPLIPQQISEFIMNAGDRVVVRGYLGEAQVGRYAVAYNIGSLLMIFLVALNQAWLPRSLAVPDAAGRTHLLEGVRDGMYGLMAPATVGLALCAPWLLEAWAPRNYARTGLVIIVVIVGVTSFPFERSFTAVLTLISLGKTKALAMNTAVASAINIGLNLVLVPYFHLVGSAVATLVAFSILSQANVSAARRAGEWRRSPVSLALLVFTVVVVEVIVATLLPTSGTPFDVIRIGGTAVSVGWFFLRLKRLASSGDEPLVKSLSSGMREPEDKQL